MNKQKNKPKIVITSAYDWGYYQWFLLGFYNLQLLGDIDFDINVGLYSSLLKYSENEFLNRVLRKIQLKKEKYSPLLEGYLIDFDNSIKHFCIDYEDSPFIYDISKLKKVNAYFKIQCPKEFNQEGFRLTDDVILPWTDWQHDNEDLPIRTCGHRKVVPNFIEYTSKIYPLMLGPRRLSYGISYKSIKRGYEKYIQDRNTVKEKKLMCYFGNSKGPVPSVDIDMPDLNWESDILCHWGQLINHPNEKRYKIAEYISTLGDDYDARIIHLGNSDTGKKVINNNTVQLKEFCKFISKFQYNFNVSGYRLSIPNRFIESFMVGTGIVTDKLSVQWYKPFSKKSVIETKEMGYLPMNKVSWENIYQDINNLPDSNPQDIVDEFNEKWEPTVVANYIVNTLRGEI